MITIKELREICKNIGYVDTSKSAKNGIQYVKIQEFAGEGRHYTREDHTLCKMKLPVVTNPEYTKYYNVRNDYRIGNISLEDANKAYEELGITRKETSKGYMLCNVPEKYVYNLSIEEMNKAIDEGRKWRMNRDNKNLMRLIDEL